MNQTSYPLQLKSTNQSSMEDDGETMSEDIQHLTANPIHRIAKTLGDSLLNVKFGLS
jgi:hypothetical protein